VTRLLRFAGVVNAAIWFGAAVFYTLGAAPSLASNEVKVLLGQSFPYYSGALEEFLVGRYFYLQLICAILALLLLLSEWLYLGHAWRKGWTYLLILMFWIVLIGAVWIAPNLRESHRAQYLLSASISQRQTSAKTFQFWNSVFQSLNILIIAGTAAYLWRTAHPSDELRFVGSSKIRG
jgi:hypothetical protein